MAKKDKEEVKVEHNLEKELNKKYGNIFIPASIFVTRKKVTIPVSPSIDLGLGGGIPEGIFVILSGPEKVGKTTTALQFSANCQKEEYGARDIFYINAETRIKERDLTSIPGLNLDKFFVIGPQPIEKNSEGVVVKETKVPTAEEFLSIIDDIVKQNPGCVIILDSESFLCSETEATSGMNEQQRADVAKIMAKFCRKTGPIIATNNCIMIIIRHMMAQPNGQVGSVEKGARSGGYKVDVRLQATWAEKWLEGDKQVGQKVEWIVKCAALDGGIPGTKVKSYLRFGAGLDCVAESVAMALDFGLITQGGAWYTCDFMKDHLDILGVAEWDKESEKLAKFQGEKKLNIQFNENPRWLELLNLELKKVLS